MTNISLNFLSYKKITFLLFCPMKKKTANIDIIITVVMTILFIIVTVVCQYKLNKSGISFYTIEINNLCIISNTVCIY